MAGKRTFLDSNVLMAAFKGEHVCHQAAMAVIDDPEREFVVSDLVRLELIPKATFHKQVDELQFYEEVFKSAAAVGSTDALTIAKATDLAATFNLNAFDACLAINAIALNAVEFVTAEKPTKPLFQIQGVPTKFVSIALQNS